MALVFFMLLAAVSVFAVPENKDLLQDGDDDYSDRLIGGLAGGIEDFPFLVGLIYTEMPKNTMIKNSLCAGTILTEYWVLTTAGCAGEVMKLSHGAEALLTHVRAGSSDSHKGGVLLPVLEKVTHEYPPNNIGLVKVEGSWPLNGITISVGRLPRQDDPIPVGSKATIVGWGMINKQAQAASILMKEEVLVISVEACNNRVMSWTKNKWRITDILICTTSHPLKKPSSAYLNDYGSPLLVDGEVVGIVSWFDINKPTFVPNVHTRVSSYIDWIEDYVGPLPRDY